MLEPLVARLMLASGSLTLQRQLELFTPSCPDKGQHRVGRSWCWNLWCLDTKDRVKPLLSQLQSALRGTGPFKGQQQNVW